MTYLLNPTGDSQHTSSRGWTHADDSFFLRTEQPMNTAICNMQSLLIFTYVLPELCGSRRGGVCPIGPLESDIFCWKVYTVICEDGDEKRDKNVNVLTLLPCLWQWQLGYVGLFRLHATFDLCSSCCCSWPRGAGSWRRTRGRAKPMTE